MLIRADEASALLIDNVNHAPMILALSTKGKRFRGMRLRRLAFGSGNFALFARDAFRLDLQMKSMEQPMHQWAKQDPGSGDENNPTEKRVERSEDLGAHGLQWI